MFTVDELTAQYDAYSDKELYDVHTNIKGYSAEAQEALEKVLQRRGGVDALMARLQDQQGVEAEKTRIIREVTALGRKGVDASFLKTTISSSVLSPQQVNEMIDGAYQQMVQERDDRKIKPRTVIGGLVGTLLAAVIGGALWGFVLYYTPDRFPVMIYVILLFGLALVCYDNKIIHQAVPEECHRPCLYSIGCIARDGYRLVNI